ncbi:hypothetical protein JOC34_000647 [Virgibacillus halotolerans]|uniref:hypothetical protein n=1 Tax=Virgibacillus halotolerans TaxID=1071053 RepID=UPI001961FB03|nr:hypothetical protein [Virgibacillus halotolerans]MBM7598290.1 hypothetical protein [Virgibacillus halotolerans]
MEGILKKITYDNTEFDLHVTVNDCNPLLVDAVISNDEYNYNFSGSFSTVKGLKQYIVKNLDGHFNHHKHSRQYNELIDWDGNLDGVLYD